MLILTEKERGVLCKFLGVMNYYDTMSILARIYSEESDMDEARKEIHSIFLKLDRL